MEEMQEKEFKKIRQNKIRNVIGIFVLLLFLGTIAFSYFHITTQGRLILREGKNVKLALDMLDVEYYGKQKSVYDSEKRNGLAEGVQKRVYDIVNQTGEFEILSYDRKEHTILCMVYEREHYRVVYQCDEDGKDQWKVDYLITIFDYEDEK
ncbi:MAG: hypothetical protein PUE95_13675 [Lachnospiraceae bacterium]|nr:hypothetical protein [Lachnospiraceae bacterium]